MEYREVLRNMFSMDVTQKLMSLREQYPDFDEFEEETRDELLFDQRWHATPAVKDLQQYIKPCMTKFNGLTFLEWSRKNGYPETAQWHPLEMAHRAAADLMINYNLV